MGTRTPDPTLVRRLAGHAFRRADTLRDERGAEPTQSVERFLRNLFGWLPPGHEPTRRIASFNNAVLQVAQTLREQTDAAVALRFQQEISSLKAAMKPLDTPALAAVFACIGEAARRRLGMWPHPVQFSGARLLLRGTLAEMRTGEGKSLVAAMAAAAMAGSGAMVQVISTNDYLAERDCQEMSPLFEFLGLAGGFIKGGMSPVARRAAYSQPVCYVSGKELVFDYLKDRMVGHGQLPARVEQLRQMLVTKNWAPEAGGASTATDAEKPMIPALHFAIVDEADSVLIDEARTPMILSREAPGIYEPELLHWAVDAAQRLQQGRHFRLGEGRQIDLLPRALADSPPMPAGVRAVWHGQRWRELLLRQALSAQHLYLRDQHYILSEGKVQIVDEATGRVMADRTWEQGLHQLIEAKEGVAITAGRETLERMTFQRFFRRYFLVSGLTGTAAEASRELWAVYRLPVRRLPTDRPIRRRELPLRCVSSLAEKWREVADDAQRAATSGQPVLVGTRSVEASEQVSEEFTRRGTNHVVLNARQDAEEANVVAAAGAAGRITVATNMAGRGTDIKPDAQAKAAGGLHVILTEFHESPRVDRQLFGRSGRQGDAGTVRAIVSTEDSLFKDLPPSLRRTMGALAGPPKRMALHAARTWAQLRAERRAYQARLQTLRQDRELSRLIGFAGRVI